MSECGKDNRNLIIAAMTFLNTVYDVDIGLWSDPVSALLIRRIAQGQLEGKPFDVSSLAATLHMPTPTVSRRVGQLIDAGWVERRRAGRSYQLWATAKTIDLAKTRLEEVKRAIYRFAETVDR